jgi:hypothetical protein
MSETTNPRAIPVITKRRPVDPSILVRSKRPAQPSADPLAPVDVDAPTAQDQTPEPATGAVATKPTAKARAAKKPITRARPAQDRVNTYIDGEIRSRAVATFKATQHLEGDDSWSEYVQTALLNEAIRREEKYNGGAQFTPSGKLQRGRAVRD